MKCLSSCLSCCGSKNTAQISPSERRQIIQAGQGQEGSPGEKSQIRVVSCRDVGIEDVGDGRGRTNPNFILGDDAGTSSVGNGSKSSLTVKALFIEVGKDRLLRVIHIPSCENEGGGKKSESGSSKSSLEGNEEEEEKSVEEKKEVKTPAADAPGGDDDEEEYWFSKWARKPRFRSIFAKNPENKPKLPHENNNNNMSNEESSKLSAEMEMKRAAAAAKRRAWAYNNNGNRESTVTQQPTVNTSDEEEFSSIAIVNSAKQQWSKNGGNGNTTEGSNPFEKHSQEESESNPFEENSPDRYNPFEGESPKSTCSSTVQVQVSVEKHGNGIENLAFQDDEDEESDPDSKSGEGDEDNSPVNKTESRPSPKLKTLRNNSNTSTASANSDIYEDAITTEQPQSSASSPLGSPPHGFTINVTPKKPILFFIHSVAGSSDVWHHQMEFFQQLGYEIVAPDLLGHGLSSTPLNPKYYMFESLVQDLILIFDHFAKEDVKVVLIGHGYGASLAAMLTRIRLKNVALLISIAGGGPTPLVRRTCCQDSWLSWKCKLFHSNRIRGRFDDPGLKHVLPPTIHANVLLGQVWADGDSAFYRRVTVPTLLVYGMRDKVVTLVEECEMERSIPKSFLELIENAGHQIMQEEPDKLNKMLYKFISSWS